MPFGEALEDEDEYVTSLIAASAKKDHARYLSTGLGALLSRKPRDSNAPKPNTRFLRHIIRETDSHNVALKAREAEESRARLRALSFTGERSTVERSTAERSNLEREGRSSYTAEREGRWGRAFSGLGGAAAGEAEHGVKRKRMARTGDGAEAGNERMPREGKRRKDDGGMVRERERERGERNGRWSSALGELGESERRQRDATGDTEREHRHSKPRHRDRHDRLEFKRDSRHAPSESLRRQRSRSSDHGNKSRRRRSGNTRSNSPEPRHRHRHSHPKVHPPSPSATNSEPNTAFLGPQPLPSQPRARGRNAHQTSTSTMDAHFSPSYDPKTDISAIDLLEQDNDDWDMALEAHRDRAKWNQAGADRLLAAGFSQEEVARWESSRGGGGEKGAEDVRWKRKGEGREWDLGKIVDGEGEVKVGVRPSWAGKGGGQRCEQM